MCVQLNLTPHLTEWTYWRPFGIEIRVTVPNLFVYQSENYAYVNEKSKPIKGGVSQFMWCVNEVQAGKMVCLVGRVGRWRAVIAALSHKVIHHLVKYTPFWYKMVWWLLILHGIYSIKNTKSYLNFSTLPSTSI